MTSSDRFPVPVRSAVKSNVTNWRCQNLSKRALNSLTYSLLMLLTSRLGGQLWTSVGTTGRRAIADGRTASCAGWRRSSPTGRGSSSRLAGARATSCPLPAAASRWTVGARAGRRRRRRDAAAAAAAADGGGWA